MAVYDHLLKLARVRFRLADDTGAGKTIMAGLLIRELQLHGLAERILVVAPSNLAFPGAWARAGRGSRTHRAPDLPSMDELDEMEERDRECLEWLL